MISLEDNELLRQYAADHSEAAFAELVRRHLNAVYAIALRQVGGDTHLAKDVAQIVFTALARKAKSLVVHPVLGGWIYRATYFTATDIVRRERRRHTHEHEAQTMSVFPNGGSVDIAWENIRPTLDRLMKDLKDGDRDAVWLRFFEERSFAEIGAKLRLTENAARMRVERALEKLQAALAGRGVKSTTAALAVALSQQAAEAAPTGLTTSITHAALAGAARVGAEGAATFKILGFMSTTKVIGFTAISLLAGLDLTLYRALDERQAAAAASAVAQRRLVQTRIRVETLKEQAKIPPSPPDQTQEQIDATREKINQIRETLGEYQSKILFNREKGQLFRQLHLSAQQITQLQSLMRSGADDAAIHQFLGDEGFKAYKAYPASSFDHSIADRLSTALDYTPTPLTMEQRYQLVNLLKNPIDAPGAAPDAANLAQSASKFLSPAQVEALQSVILEENARQSVYSAFANPQKGPRS